MLAPTLLNSLPETFYHFVWVWLSGCFFGLLRAVEKRLSTVIQTSSIINLSCAGEPDNDRNPTAELQKPVSARDAGAAGRGEMC